MSLALVNKVDFSPKQIQLIKRRLCPTASEDELSLFIGECKRTQLDPFTRQIFLVPRWNSKLGRNTHTTQVAIDGLRLIAERSSSYEGQAPAEWSGDGISWVQAWINKEPPAAARVGVYKKGFREATYAVALWSEYASFYRDRNGVEKLSPTWKKMPVHMLAKCAEALALRKAFPNDMSGLYTDDEMSQASNNEPRPARTQARDNVIAHKIEKSKAGDFSLSFGAFKGVAIKLMDEDTLFSQTKKMQEWIKGNESDERAEEVNAFLNAVKEYINNNTGSEL